MFDYEKYKQLMSLLKKQAQFVPMDPSMGGGGMPPEGDPSMGGGMPPPGDPAAMGGMPPPPPGDPAAMGGMPPPPPPGDPAAMGGMPPPPPGDPMGGMPPPPEDPAASGDVSPSGEPYMKITPTQLSKLFKQFAEVFKSVLGISGQGAVAPAAQPQQPPAIDNAKLTEVDAKLDALLRG